MLIELGDPAAAPETTRSPRTTGSRPVAFVAVVLAVLALGGSVAAASRIRVVLITDEMAGAFTLSSSALFTSEVVSSRPLARRYSLTGGSIQWSTELPQPVGDVELAEAARVLVVTSPENAQASFLDSDTGAVLWRRASGVTVVLGLSADSVLMTSALASGEDVLLQRVGLRTGATLWSRKLDAGGYVSVGDPGSGTPNGIVMVDRQGRGAVLAFADGAVRTTANLGVAPDTGPYTEEGDTARYVTVGDRLYLTRRQSGAGSLTAYRLTDLRPLWRNTAVPFGRPTGCGGHLCVSNDDGMTSLHADTGEARWSSTHWQLEADSRTLRIPGPPRLVVTEAGHATRHALLDPATGRIRSALGHSQQVGALVLRLDSERIGRTWIQAVGASDELRTVGSLDGMSLERCTAAGSHLACADRNGRANVWQLTDP